MLEEINNAEEAELDSFEIEEDEESEMGLTLKNVSKGLNLPGASSPRI